jgi:MraZ protein
VARSFVGEFEHAIDEKGRLVLPSVFRGAFEEGAVLATRPDGCVGLMTSDRFEQEAQEIRHNAPPGEVGRMKIRVFYAKAVPVTPDKAGRIVVPVKLRDYAQLGSDCLVIGVGDLVELWNPQRFEAGSAAGFDAISVDATTAHPLLSTEDDDDR